MLDILKEAELKKFKKGGKANKLSLYFLRYYDNHCKLIHKEKIQIGI
ncbi:hypothetical protein [Spiroplasma endosymbiont of Polydrusus pterygomalis]